MQKSISLILACASAVLLAICLLQFFEIAAQKTQLTALHESSKTTAVQIKTLQGTVKRLEAQRAAYNKELRNLAEQNSDLAAQKKELTTTHVPQANGTPAVGTKKEQGFGGMLADMMKDPEMKKAMQEQQKQMLKTMYGPLLKDLKLSPEQNEKFNALMLEHQMQAMDKASELMSKDTNRPELTKEMKSGEDAFEAKMKELLGDYQFANYKDYSQSMPDRMTMDQFNKQFSDIVLNDQQQQEMLRILREERKNSGMADISKTESMEKLLSGGGGLDKWMAQQKEINDRVYARATEILSPEQLQSFGAFQTNQFQLQQMGMKMAAKMWGTQTNEPAQ